MSLLGAHLLELLPLAGKQEYLFTLHLALFRDQVALNVVRKAFDRSLHRLLLVVWVVLHFLGIFKRLLITFVAFVDLRTELAFLLEFFLLLVTFVSDPVVDLVAPDLIALEERSSLPILVGEVVVA